MQHEDMILGYRVTAETMTDESDPARGEWVDCWVTSQCGKHSNSLGLLDDTGAFDDGPKISDSALEQIRAWAERHGY